MRAKLNQVIAIAAVGAGCLLAPAASQADPPVTPPSWFQEAIAGTGCGWQDLGGPFPGYYQAVDNRQVLPAGANPGDATLIASDLPPRGPACTRTIAPGFMVSCISVYEHSLPPTRPAPTDTAFTLFSACGVTGPDAMQLCRREETFTQRQNGTQDTDAGIWRPSDCFHQPKAAFKQCDKSSQTQPDARAARKRRKHKKPSAKCSAKKKKKKKKRGRRR